MVVDLSDPNIKSLLKLMQQGVILSFLICTLWNGCTHLNSSIGSSSSCSVA